MSKPTIPELIVSIYKGDATSTEDAPVTQARRNQRSKVKKQIDNKQLEWKYTLPLIEFCEKNNSEVSEGSMVTELEEDLESERERVIKLYDRISDLNKKIVSLETKENQTIEWNKIQLDQKIKEYKPQLKEEMKTTFNDELEDKKRLINSLRDKLERKHNQLEECKNRPTQERFDSMKRQLEEMRGHSGKHTLSKKEKKRKEKEKYKKKLAALCDSSSDETDSDSD